MFLIYQPFELFLFGVIIGAVFYVAVKTRSKNSNRK